VLVGVVAVTNPASDFWETGRVVIICFGLALTGLAEAINRLKKPKRRG